MQDPVCEYLIFHVEALMGSLQINKKNGFQLGWTMTTRPGSGLINKNNMEAMVKTLKDNHWMAPFLTPNLCCLSLYAPQHPIPVEISGADAYAGMGC